MSKGRISSTLAKTGAVEQRWHHVDASDQVLGRLAVSIARILMGKHRAIYTPHVDTGEYVVVTNVDKLKITGNKRQAKKYGRYSQYPGGYKEESLGRLMDRVPERVLTTTVRRMLPKHALGRRMLKKLKCYRGDSHPHGAQRPIPWEL